MPGEANEATTGAQPGRGDDMPLRIMRLTPSDRARYSYSSEEVPELEGKVKSRREHPDLIPSMFLGTDYDETAKRAFGTLHNVGVKKCLRCFWAVLGRPYIFFFCFS